MVVQVFKSLVIVGHIPVVVRISSEGDLELFQELVHSGEEGLRRAGRGLDGGLALEDDDAVGQVGGHDEVVLHDESGLFSVQDEALDHLNLNIEIKIKTKKVCHYRNKEKCLFRIRRSLPPSLL